MRYLFLSFLCFLLACNLSAESTEMYNHQPQEKYAIYLTTGSKAHNCVDADWGGCHITLAGFHQKHGNEALISKIPEIIKDTSRALRGWRPRHIIVQKWGKQWAVVFHSRTLNKIARQLRKQGFKKVKGPEFCHSPFHMVIPHLKDQKAAEEFASTLKQKEWFITHVEINPSMRPYRQASWLSYFHL